jgi:chemotaxis protein MotB
MADTEEEEKKCPDPPVCEECPPEGAPAWMATFSDLVTLLLTFFVLLYAMSKQDDSKFQSVAGSIRKAFAGNARKVGETIQLGKSPDDSPTMIENQEPVKPFPIDTLTTDGFLDKHEINRDSTEDLVEMRKILADYNLTDAVKVEELPEGIKVRVKDRITFKKGTTEIDDISVRVFQRVIKLMQDNNWTLFVEGYAEPGERSLRDSTIDAFALSAQRATQVTRSLIQRGVRPEKITTVFYGDTRAVKGDKNRKVEFVLRKVDLLTKGHRVGSQ